MTERKFVSDKRVLAHNPFKRIDDNWFDVMDDYTFLDFLKINRAICTEATYSIERDIKPYYDMLSPTPVHVVQGPQHMIMDLKIDMIRNCYRCKND